MPVFPKHFSVPRDGQLVPVTVRNPDELRKLRTELELLRRVNRQMLIRTMAAGQAPPEQYSAADNIELQHILGDASHPLVAENISQIDRDFVNTRKDIMMAAVNNEADSIFYEAIEAGATCGQDTQKNETTSPIADAPTENTVTPDTVSKKDEINDELLQATAELAEVVGLDLSSAEAMNVAIEDEHPTDSSNTVNNTAVESSSEDATGSMPSNNDATATVITCGAEEPCIPAVLSDGTSGDAGTIVEIEAPALPNETVPAESDMSNDAQSDDLPQDVTEADDRAIDDSSDQIDEVPKSECEVDVLEDKISAENVEHDTHGATVDDMIEDCDKNHEITNQDDISTACDPLNIESAHVKYVASIDKNPSCDHPQHEPTPSDLSSAEEESAAAEISPELTEVPHENDAVEDHAYTPDSAKEMLDVLHQGLRKLSNILSTQVSEDWHRASDAMTDILKKREQVESAVIDAESLVADLKSLKTEATAARDAIVAALEDVKLRCDGANQPEQGADGNVVADEL